MAKLQTNDGFMDIKLPMSFEKTESGYVALIARDGLIARHDIQIQDIEMFLNEAFPSLSIKIA